MQIGRLVTRLGGRWWLNRAPAGLVTLAATAVLVLVASFSGALTPLSASRQSYALLPVPSPSLPAITPPHLPTPSLPAITPPRLPTPSLPAVTPPVLPSLPPVSPPALPTPSLPVGPSPTPSIHPVGASPSPSATPGSAAGGPGAGAGGPGTGGAGNGQGPPQGGIYVQVPFTTIVLTSALDVALAVAVAVLPLLLGVWLLLFGRTWNQARQARDAGIRLALAHDLGLSPRELASLSTVGLFKLREQAAFDDLTGVMRRAAGIAATERELARARRQKSPLAVAFIDVDGLKQANDSQGHAAGDKLLRGLASGLRSGLRGQDLVLRYGGDEFVCVLPDTTLDAARAKLHLIRDELKKVGIGFSIGIVQLDGHEDVVSLLGRADDELYQAKAQRPGKPAIRSASKDQGKRILA